MSSSDKRRVRGWIRIQDRSARRRVMPAVTAGLLSTILGIAQAALAGQIMATALLGRTTGVYGATSRALVALSVVVVLRVLLGAWQEHSASRAGTRGRRELRGAFIRQIVAFGPALLRRDHSAVIAATIVDRVEALEGYFSRWMPASILALASPAAVLIGIGVLCPRVFWVFLGFGLAVPFAQAVFGIGAARTARSQFLAMLRLQTRFLDRVRGIATIVLANADEREASALGEAADDLRTRTMRVLRVAFLSSSAIDIAMVGTILGVVYFYRHDLLAAFAHGAGQNMGLLGAALTALMLVPEFYAPLRAMALAYQDKAQAANTAAAALSLEQDTEAGRDSLPMPDAVTISVEKLSFSWDSARGPVLRDIDFSAGPGDILVLDGPSGAGKSTITELLLGFIRPDGGHIRFNGVDVTTLSPRTMSQLIAWVGQRPVIFAGTLRDNLLFARPGASDEQLWAAIQGAALDRVLVELPHGLETVIGEGGYGLSGGQAQRVAIARALLKEAPVLLLDEPTSHLDPATERHVMDALVSFSRNRTVVLCSHSAALRAIGSRRLALASGALLEEAA